MRAECQAIDQRGYHCSVLKNGNPVCGRGTFRLPPQMVKVANETSPCHLAGSHCISDSWLNGQEVTYYNTNELINPESPYFYEAAAGLKTGKSESAGNCLVSCAYIADELYICVVMGSPEEGRWRDSLTLYHAISQ